jgi:cell division septal protein FtsQ
MKTINSPKKNPSRSKKRKPINFARLFFYCTFLIFLISVPYLFFFSPFMRIVHVEITGNENISEEEILEKINSELSGNFLFFLEKRNFFVLSPRKMEQLVLSEFRQIRSVEAEKKFPSEIRVKIFERTPSLVLCADKCFILDEQGEAYREKDISDGTEESNLFHLEDLSRKEILLGEKNLDSQYVDYLTTLKVKVDDEIVLTQNEIQTPSLVSKDIRVMTHEGWRIFFNQNIDIEKELEMLKAVLKNKIGEKQRVDLEYVDLRIDNKVYYKFKDGTESEKARLASLETLPETETPSVTEEKEEEKKKKKR